MVGSIFSSKRTYADDYEAGYTYCGIASLKLINRLSESPDSLSLGGIINVPSTIHWLVSRQIGSASEEEEENEEHALPVKLQGFYIDEPAHEEAQFVGMNGRCNKRADTCYAFWVGAALEVCYL